MFKVMYKVKLYAIKITRKCDTIFDSIGLDRVYGYFLKILCLIFHPHLWNQSLSAENILKNTITRFQFYVSWQWNIPPFKINFFYSFHISVFPTSQPQRLRVIFNSVLLLTLKSLGFQVPLVQPPWSYICPPPLPPSLALHWFSIPLTRNGEKAPPSISSYRSYCQRNRVSISLIKCLPHSSLPTT